MVHQLNRGYVCCCCRIELVRHTVAAGVLCCVWCAVLCCAYHVRIDMYIDTDIGCMRILSSDVALHSCVAAHVSTHLRIHHLASHRSTTSHTTIHHEHHSQDTHTQHHAHMHMQPHDTHSDVSHTTTIYTTDTGTCGDTTVSSMGISMRALLQCYGFVLCGALCCYA